MIPSLSRVRRRPLPTGQMSHYLSGYRFQSIGEKQ